MIMSLAGVAGLMFSLALTTLCGELAYLRVEKSRVLCGKKSAVWKLETLELCRLCFMIVGLSVVPSMLPRFSELALALSW